jgi:methionyl-tRNA formyltransferase
MTPSPLLKIVFFGTSENSVILLEGIAPHFDVVGIVTTPDSNVGRKQTLTPSLVAQFAAASEQLRGVPLFKPEKLKDPGFIAALTALAADLFIVLSYGKILPLEVINIPRLKTINIHPSLLPLYRGATPMPAALLDGAATTGNTIIVMDEEMDHGPILAQREMAIAPDETYLELERKLALDSVALVLETVPAYAEGRLQPKEQDHTAATYTGRITKEDGKVDWALPAQTIYNRYRAFARWPGIWTLWNGETLKILSCRPAAGTAADQPGTVLPSGAVVCGDSKLLELVTIQRAGKNPTDIKSFLNGNKNFAGAILN